MMPKVRRWRTTDLIRNLLFALVAGSSLLLFGGGEANVIGNCSDCHTMHNSQAGRPVYREGAGVGWGGSTLSGGSVREAPADNLLVANCVGCHTSTSSQTIVTIGGGNRIPIVYNTAPPSTPLAGGNFYWVAQGDNTKGHNVYGIAGSDILTSAPGDVSACASSCHTSLAGAPGSAQNLFSKGGCEGCHVFTYHHDDNGVYRFLKGHGSPPPQTITPDRRNIKLFPDYVTGVEDSDWEYTVSSNDHNFYRGTNTPYDSLWPGRGLTNQQTVTAFCSGCHGRFHGPVIAEAGMGSSSPWIRHPTDIFLPSTGEFGPYDPVAAYNAKAPVAYTDPANPSRATAVVTCLSCHRAHGSPYYKMMRWDYKSNNLSDALSGCNVCHTSKN